MKNIIYILFMVFAFASITAAQDCTSALKINTNREESAIYINNKFEGKGKLSAELPKGKYAILLKEAFNEWDPETITDTIDIVNCGEEITRTYTFSEKILLNTEPQNAEVFAGDTLLGYTPLFLSYKNYELSLRKKNYEGKNIFLKDIGNAEQVKLRFTGEEHNNRFIYSPWFKVLLGTAVVFGSTAAYFKIKADNDYDKYLDTKKQSYLDSTDKNDLISGIAFGALQVNFGILIYYFLSD